MTERADSPCLFFIPGPLSNPVVTVFASRQTVVALGAEPRWVIEWARSHARPVVATEALGRPNHGELHEILPLFGEHGIGWYLWELMIGADQTRYQRPDSPPVADGIVFQGLLYPDGTPYREDEVQLIRSS